MPHDVFAPMSFAGEVRYRAHIAHMSPRELSKAFVDVSERTNRNLSKGRAVTREIRGRAHDLRLPKVPAEDDATEVYSCALVQQAVLDGNASLIANLFGRAVVARVSEFRSDAYQSGDAFFEADRSAVVRRAQRLAAPEESGNLERAQAYLKRLGEGRAQEAELWNALFDYAAQGRPSNDPEVYDRSHALAEERVGIAERLLRRQVSGDLAGPPAMWSADAREEAFSLMPEWMYAPFREIAAFRIAHPMTV